MREELAARLADFVAKPGSGHFDVLARDVLRHQEGSVPAYGRLVARSGGLGATWRDAPLVPTEIFRELDLAPASDAPPAAMFRTSGTTGRGRKGTRRVIDLTLYRLGMEAPFVEAVLGGASTPKPWISLIPPYRALPESSLAYMVDALATTFARELHHVATLESLDVAAAHAHLVAYAEGGEPVVLLTTALALVTLLEALEGRVQPLAPGSRMMLTGGFKGRVMAVREEDLLAQVEASLGLPASSVVAEYGMTELTSQIYGRPFRAPPWLKLRVLDPVTLADRPSGTPGLVAFFDLLNLDNVSAILSSDLGVLDASGGLTLLGRAPDAPVRGCSLVAEAWEGA